MQVLAAPGLKVPMEEKPRDYITDTPPEGEAGFTVPDTVYYARRLLEGDLIEVTAPAKTNATTPSAGTRKGGA